MVTCNSADLFEQPLMINIKTIIIADRILRFFISFDFELDDFY
jgi:hypothetical protein